MSYYNGQKYARHYYKVDLSRNGVLVTPAIAKFTTKKEAEKMANEMNKTAKNFGWSRKATVKKCNIHKFK